MRGWVEWQGRHSDVGRADGVSVAVFERVVVERNVDSQYGEGEMKMKEIYKSTKKEINAFRILHLNQSADRHSL